MISGFFTNKKTIFVMACALVLGMVGAVLAVPTAIAQSAPAGGVKVERAWARPALEGGHGAVYFTITNLSDEAVTLVGAEADVSQVVEIHQTVLLTEEETAKLQHEGHDHHDHDHHAHQDHHDDHAHHDHHDHGHHDHGGTFVMLHVDELKLAPGEEVVFGPAGYHVMLINLTKTLVWDESFPITLSFAEAPSVTVWVTVGDEPGH